MSLKASWVVPAAAAEDADDEVRIVGGEFLHRLRAAIDDFQKDGPPAPGHAREAADDVVVDEAIDHVGGDAGIDIRVEHFEEVAEGFPRGRFAEFLGGEWFNEMLCRGQHGVSSSPRASGYGARMKLLLTNDDGIDAPGLRALLSVARDFGEPVVVAPATPQSGMSHVITWESGVRLEGRGEGQFAIHGTPADCTRIGLLHVAPETSWVLSGINQGGNLGADVYYSGTVAAVREAVLHGWPGIAFSHYLRRGLEPDWERAAQLAAVVLPLLLARPVEPGLFYNVNLPHPEATAPDPDVVFCPLDPHPLPLSYRHENDHHYYDGDYQARQRKPGADVDVCFNGRIAVTVMRLF